VRYKIVIFDGGVEEIVIWAGSVDVGDLNVTSSNQLCLSRYWMISMRETIEPWYDVYSVDRSAVSQ
jgi:hypothetical protein